MTRSDEVFEAILHHWREYAVPPVMRDVLLVTGVTSTSMVRFYYGLLVKSKRIILVRGHPVPVEIERLIKESYHD